MNQMEYRAKVLEKHMGITEGDIANHFDVTRRELKSWFQDINNVPEGTLESLADYFQLEKEDLYKELTVQVEYQYLSYLANQIGNSLRRYQNKSDYDIEQLMDDLEETRQGIVAKLIEKQEEIKIK